MQNTSPQMPGDRPLLALFHLAFEPMLVVDGNGQCLAANAAACDLWGWSSEELQNRHLRELCLGRMPTLQDHAALASPTTGRQTIRCANGQHRWVSYRMVPLETQAIRTSVTFSKILFTLREDPITSEPQPPPPTMTASSLPPTSQPMDWWYRAAFNQTTHMASLLSPEGIVLVDNQTALDSCQLALEDVVGQSFVDLGCWQISPATQARLREAIATAAAGESVRYETEILTRGQSPITIDFSLKPIRNLEGRVALLLAEGLNITAQKQIERALRQSEALFSVAFQANPEPMVIVTLDGDRLLEVNEQFCQMTGYQRNELIGVRILDLNLWLRLEDQAAMVSALQETGRLSQYEATFRIKSGELRVGLISGQVVEINQQRCILGTVNDITERKRTEEALQLSQMKERALLTSIPDLLLHLRRDGSCLACFMPLENAERYIPIQHHIAEVLPADILADELVTIAQVLASGQVALKEYSFIKRGRPFTEEVRIVPMNAEEVLVMVRDITDRKQAETALRETEARLQDVLNNSAAYVTRIWVYDNHTWEYDYVSAACERLYGYTAAEIQADRDLWRSRIVPEDFTQVIQPKIQQILNGATEIVLEYRFRHRDGSLRWISENSTVRYDATRSGWLLTIVAIDITERKQAEATLQQQQERERLLGAVTQHIRRSLDLQEVLNTAAQEVRHLLQADRTLIYRLQPDGSGEIVVESVQDPWPAVLGTTLYDPCFRADLVEPYRQGRVHQIDDLEAETLSPCHTALLTPFQVRSHLVVPIIGSDRLWGLFCIHQCSQPRAWQSSDVELLKQLCERLAIAIQQSELYERVQHLNANLEQQVQERTRALETSLRFEALMRQITTQMRDNLDERHIVQTAVDGVGRELEVLCCDVALYDSSHTTVTIQWEYNPGLEPLQNFQFAIAESGDPEVYYHHLLQGESVQVCPLYISPIRPSLSRCTMLICPILDDQEVLGDVWLVKPAEQWFEQSELQLVQQVANQCAIALRQAHLYQMAQAQVVELERLNRLKDDFLSTVSHELRTPMANIKMSTEMVELRLSQRNILGSGTDQPLERYFAILKDACQREIRLIDDLLDLTRLNSDIDPIIPFQVQLRPWVVHIAESFRDRIHRQQQTLHIAIPDDLMLETDLAYLERIVTELLNNACKYTPLGETISVSGEIVESQIQLIFTNTGVSLPPEECERIFEQFYRIPSSDPWRHEGTGLGLALVRKFTEKLGGTIRAESSQHELQMILTFPPRL